MLHGPQIAANLADAIADAKATKNLVFPYLGAAEHIFRTWPSERWPNPPRALRSGDFEAQAELAQSLRPYVQEAQKFFNVRLNDWYKLLDDLSAPLNTRMQQDFERRIAETSETCQMSGFRYCAREVRMEMAAPVDYVKVEYTQEGVYTKLKFFRDGRIMKTRGEEAAQGKPLRLYSPTPQPTSSSVTGRPTPGPTSLPTPMTESPTPQPTSPRDVIDDVISDCTSRKSSNQERDKCCLEECFGIMLKDFSSQVRASCVRTCVSEA